MPDKPKRVNYRKLAFEEYEHMCAYCGFAIPAILEVAHIDGSRANNELDNLVILCPTHHKMLDLDIIDNRTIKHMRNRMQDPPINQKKRMKDAGAKAARKRDYQRRGRKAAVTKATKAAKND